MAKEEKTLGLGEISTIRDILMGQQIAEFEKRFAEIKSQEEKMERDIQKKITSLEKDIDSRLSALEKDMGNRFDKLESLIKDNINALDGKLNKVTKSDKEMLGQLLQDMGKKLLNGKSK